jgi:hypothetical protein
MRGGAAERFEERRRPHSGLGVTWAAAPSRPPRIGGTRQISDYFAGHGLRPLMTKDEVTHAGQALLDLETRRKEALRRATIPGWARTHSLNASTVTQLYKVETISKTMQVADP